MILIITIRVISFIIEAMEHRSSQIFISFRVAPLICSLPTPSQRFCCSSYSPRNRIYTCLEFETYLPDKALESNSLIRDSILFSLEDAGRPKDILNHICSEPPLSEAYPGEEAIDDKFID
jgi:hypothetical protein